MRWQSPRRRSARSIQIPLHPSVTLQSCLRLKGILRRRDLSSNAHFSIRENILGPEHPETIESLDNLATCRFAQGNVVVSRQLLERIVEIREKVLGPDHPITAMA